MIAMKTNAHAVLAALAAIAAMTMLAAGCSRSQDDAPEQAAPDAPQTLPRDEPILSRDRAETPAAASADADVNAASLGFDLPEGWRAVAPGMMRIAELRAPVPEGVDASEAAEIVFFHFGPQGAGSVQDNIARWANLVLDDDDEHAEPDIKTHTVNDLRITEVLLMGDYMSGMPGGPQTRKPDFALVGAIIEGGPEGPVYVRMTGPQPVAQSHLDAWNAMIRSVRATR